MPGSTCCRRTEHETSRHKLKRLVSSNPQDSLRIDGRHCRLGQAEESPHRILRLRTPPPASQAPPFSGEAYRRWASGNDKKPPDRTSGGKSIRRPAPTRAAFGERHCNYVRQMRIKVLSGWGLGRGKKDAHSSLLLILYSLAYVRRQQVGPGTARSERPSPQRSPTSLTA